MDSFLKIKIIETNDFHKDLILSVPALDVYRRADSYFLLIDRNSPSLSVGYKKVREILKIILEGWKLKINELKLGQIDYLPFDFSDQYIGCIRVNLIEEGRLTIQYGGTQKIMGIDIYPSELKDFVLTEDDFYSDSKLLVLGKDELDECLNKSIDELMD